ncbi:MAG: glycosyltransferase N-terminal domain-containing protein, partial [Bacteroidota bacterium]
MRLLYDFVLFFYHNGIRLAAFFHPKAQKWTAGRKQLFQQLPPANKKKKRVWMHCASLGEFEQGRPLLEALKQQYPKIEILLTFYSPSGYELRKNYAGANFIHYLPPDTAANANRFLQICQPDLAIFVKYEFWYHYLTQLKQNAIPSLLIAAQFRPNQLFFRSYGGFFRKMLTQFEQIFAQDHRSTQLLDQIGLSKYQVSGDPRVDRVQQIAEQKQSWPIIERFCGKQPLFIAGSTWPADEAILIPFLKDQLPNHWKVIIAPHEIHSPHLKQLQNQLPFPSQLYSRAQKQDEAARIMIIDNVGMLSSVYQYGRIAYIGGGFGKGIHNTL